MDRVNVPRYKKGKRKGQIKEIEGEMFCKKHKRVTVHYVLYKDARFKKSKGGKKILTVYYVCECGECWKEKGIPGKDEKHYRRSHMTAAAWEAFLDLYYDF